MYERRDIAAVPRDLADETRADMRGVERRNHEDRLQPRRQVAVHERHLILILEIAHGAQTANEQRCALLAGKIDEQPSQTLHLDPRVAGDGRANELDALLDREERVLRRV